MNNATRLRRESAIPAEIIDEICDQFESDLNNGHQPVIERVVKNSALESHHLAALTEELIGLEVDFRGIDKDPGLLHKEYVRRFPLHAEFIRALVPLAQTENSETRSFTQPAGSTDRDTDRLLGESGRELRPGTRFGHYEILSEVARGGMGVVYKAVQTNASRVVALKTILSGFAASEEAIERFQNESQMAAALDHSGIVPVFEVGEIEGQHFYSMGYVEGDSLSERLRSGPLSSSAAGTMLKKVAAAVVVAHQAGIIHRDLKPSNILLDQGDVPKVTDFGLARQSACDSDLTATGQIVGTPGYMAPEQASGASSAVTFLSDVYSLGAVLYAALKARPPFQAAHSVETLRQVLDDEPVAPRLLNPDVDRDLETICLKCLRKDPASRYQSASELFDELTRYTEGRPILAVPVSRREHIIRWCRRNRLVAGLGAGVVGALILGFTCSVYFAVLAGRQTEQAQRHEQLALTTLETIIDTVQDRLRPIPEAREIRRQILQDALTGLKTVEAELKNRNRVSRDTAVALVNLGRLHVEIGDEDGMNSNQKAEENFVSAAAMMNQLCSDESTDNRLLNDKAWALEELGNYYLDTNQAALAEPVIHRAVRIRRLLHSRPGDHAQTTYRLSLALNDWGDLLSMTGRHKESLKFFTESIPMAEDYAAAHPESLEAQDHLLTSYRKAGDSLHDQKRNAEALRCFELSLEKTRQVYGDRADTIEARDALSYCYERLGNHWLQVGEARTAMTMFMKMRDLLEENVMLDPANRMFREGLACAHCKIAKAHLRLGNKQDSVIARQTADDIRAELAQTAADSDR